MHDVLPLVFAAVLVAAIAVYVCLDGMDLGVGILYLLAPTDNDRDLMIATIEPVWDGNETWLVLGAMVMFAGFPVALAALLPALYLPIMGMLLSLVLRGIAFEFRAAAHHSKRAWDFVFSFASLAATIFQGLVLGAYVSGVIVPDHTPPMAFLSWFSVATALGLVAGYALLGSTWLIWRTGRGTQTFARRVARPALIGVALLILVISVWTPIAQVDIARRWFSWPNMGYLSVIPLATALNWVALWRSIQGRRDLLPYLLSIGLFGLGLFGLCVSLYPDLVPHRLTIWQSASRPATLRLTGIGLALCLPVVVGYLSFSYWVFRGKVTGHAHD